MEKLTFDQMESLQAGRPMVGSTTTCEDRACFNAQTGGEDPCCVVSTTKYFFWIKVSEGNGSDDGMKYGSCEDNQY